MLPLSGGSILFLPSTDCDGFRMSSLVYSTYLVHFVSRTEIAEVYL